MNPLFAHERLQVYVKALAFGARASAWTGTWSKKHALVDQLYRASESVVLNIAEGNGRFSVLDHHRFLQMADRASVKAAVYLDLAVKKGLVDAAGVSTGKELFRRVSAMLGGF